MRNRFLCCLAGIALIALGGCAAQVQDAKNAFAFLTNQSVTPQSVIIAANTFDGIEVTAKNYLLLPWCTTGGATICKTPAGVNAIVPAVRSGRSARNQLEASINANPGAPVSITPYNVLTAAISSLQSALAQYNAGQ